MTSDKDGPDDINSNSDHNAHPSSRDNVVSMPAWREQAEQRTARPPSDRVRMRVTLDQRNPPARGGQAAEPAINLPGFTKILLLGILAIHLLVTFALNNEQHYWVMEHFGFVAADYSAMGTFHWTSLLSPFTYAFLHGGWTHVIMNAVMLMAFGAGLERWMGWRRMALLMLGCSLVSIMVQYAVDLHSMNPVIGASGAISGMFAAAIVMIQQQRGSPFGGRYGLMPFIIVWIVIAVAFGMMGGPGGEMIAWPAHIGGFLAGLALVKPVMRLKI